MKVILLIRVPFRICILSIAAYLAFCCLPGAYAQETSRPSAPDEKQEAPRPAVQKAKEHPFWDVTNSWLFAGVGASRTLDNFSTLNMRARGRQEILLNNDVVDNHAAFATVETAGTGVSIAASYLFHRTGHHKLERLTSIVHISAARTSAVRNYCLKTAHATPSSTP